MTSGPDVDVRPLPLATLTLPDGHPAAPEVSVCVVLGFAIVHPDGLIVVDTGVGAGHALIDDLYDPDVTLLAAALLVAGLDERDVVAVVNSHLHFDHCGQNPAFFGGSVAIHVQQAELALLDDPIYTVDEWARPPARQLRTVRGDETIAPGVRVIATPGHTSGHQSVVVETGDRPVVIGAQVVWQPGEYASVEASPLNVDDPDLRAAAVDSIERIRSLRPQRVHLSHCVEPVVG